MGIRKKPKVPGLTRVALAENVRYLMEQEYIASRDKPRSLAQDAGVGLYTVQRILEATSGANLDTIEAIGRVFHVEPHELLTPNFAKKRRQSDTGEPNQRERVVALARRSKSSPRLS